MQFNDAFILFLMYKESVKEIFTAIKFSEKGTINRHLEEQTYMFFRDFLDECEGIVPVLYLSEINVHNLIHPYGNYYNLVNYNKLENTVDL